MLAVRNAAYGLSLAPILPARLRDRAMAAQLVIDETTAMARAQDDPRRGAAGVPGHRCQRLAVLERRHAAGALLGGGLGDPRTLGLDAMFPAAFLALLAPQLRRAGAPVAAVAGAVVAVVAAAVRAGRGAGDRRARRRRTRPAARPGRAARDLGRAARRWPRSRTG